MSKFKWFNLDWLTSPARAKLKEELIKEVLEELKSPEIDESSEWSDDDLDMNNNWEDEGNSTVRNSKIKFTYFYNDTCTLITMDGYVLTGTMSHENYENYVKNAQYLEDAEDFFYLAQEVNIEECLTEEQVRLINENINILHLNTDFAFDNNKVYLRGVNLVIPPIIVTSFIELLEKMQLAKMHFLENEVCELETKYNSLKMFWLWLSMNPIESSRNDLLRFIRNNDIKLTANGQMILYRRAYARGKKESKFINFITSEMFRIQNEFKKSPQIYTVYKKDEEYISSTTAVIDATEEGNLLELYKNLPNLSSNTLTDAHTRTMTIKVGAIYAISEDKVDINSRAGCSSGLHVASRNYDYSGFGDTPLLCIVNPSKVRSVPHGDTGKVRVSEMFIAAILDIDENGKYMDEDLPLINFDVDYCKTTVNELGQMANNQDFKGLNCQNTEVVLSPENITNIINLVKNRVILV